MVEYHCQSREHISIGLGIFGASIMFNVKILINASVAFDHWSTVIKKEFNKDCKRVFFCSSALQSFPKWRQNQRFRFFSLDFCKDVIRQFEFCCSSYSFFLAWVGGTIKVATIVWFERSRWVLTRLNKFRLFFSSKGRVSKVYFI